MILITPRPLSDPETDRLRQWVQMPEAYEFQRWLCNKRAEAAAEAANILMDAQRDPENEEVRESDRREAESRVALARVYDDTLRLFQEITRKDFNFQVADLNPMPPTLPSTEL